MGILVDALWIALRVHGAVPTSGPSLASSRVAHKRSSGVPFVVAMYTDPLLAALNTGELASLLTLWYKYKLLTRLELIYLHFGTRKSVVVMDRTGS